MCSSDLHAHLTRATAILRGLSHNLDVTRGGAMADRLFRTYNALIMACLRSYGRPQAKENFRRIIASLTELRDAWKFVEATAGKAAKAKTSEKTLESAAGR